jgi:hypothetical protein
MMKPKVGRPALADPSIMLTEKNRLDGQHWASRPYWDVTREISLKLKYRPNRVIAVVVYGIVISIWFFTSFI